MNELKETFIAVMISIFRAGVKPEQKKEPAVSREIKRFHENTAQSRLIPEIHSIQEVSPQQILEIAGLGEVYDELDGLPLQQKLQQALDRGYKAVVADALDDEPYLSSRLSVFAQLRDEVISGLRLCGKALGLPDSALSVAVYQPMLYFLPKIAEEQEVPLKRYGGKYPVDLPLRQKGEENGILYLGTGALVHLYRAVYEMRRQTTAFVTLAGNCVSNPFNAELPLDMPFQRALEFCGLAENPTYICFGGSMTGEPVLDPEKTFVTPSTRAILAFHSYDHVDAKPCIGCGRCMQVCPQRLPVFYLYQASVHKQLSVLRRMDAIPCLECGACSYVCPSRLNIVPVLTQGYEMVRKRREQVAQMISGDVKAQDLPQDGQEVSAQ